MGMSAMCRHSALLLETEGIMKSIGKTRYWTKMICLTTAVNLISGIRRCGGRRTGHIGVWRETVRRRGMGRFFFSAVKTVWNGNMRKY